METRPDLFIGWGQRGLARHIADQVVERLISIEAAKGVEMHPQFTLACLVAQETLNATRDSLGFFRAIAITLRAQVEGFDDKQHLRPFARRNRMAWQILTRSSGNSVRTPPLTVARVAMCILCIKAYTLLVIHGYEQ